MAALAKWKKALQAANLNRFGSRSSNQTEPCGVTRASGSSDVAAVDDPGLPGGTIQVSASRPGAARVDASRNTERSETR